MDTNSPFDHKIHITEIKIDLFGLWEWKELQSEIQSRWKSTVLKYVLQPKSMKPHTDLKWNFLKHFISMKSFLWAVLVKLGKAMKFYTNKTMLCVCLELLKRIWVLQDLKTQSPAWQRFTESSLLVFARIQVLISASTWNPREKCELLAKAWGNGRGMESEERPTLEEKSPFEVGQQKSLIQVSHICLLPRARILESPHPLIITVSHTRTCTHIRTHIKAESIQIYWQRAWKQTFSRKFLSQVADKHGC